MRKRPIICRVCGLDLASHRPFGDCYRKAMNGEPNRGKAGRDLKRGR